MATVISVRGGAEPDIWHGLSAAYLGLTVVYGHSTLRWADQKFAKRFGETPAGPTPEPLYGRQAIAAAWRSWLRFLLAYTLSVSLTAALVALTGDSQDSGPLLVWLNPLTKILIYSLIWPVITTLRPGRPPQPQPDSAGS
ncbi:hypothetical protein [Streptomyces sp. NPDC058579]|uniref:hypothetical protein n=1 Tax=Streptomyces sp. NPDC058579 TaxID=3346548 RepID=UPI003664A387